jgi:hypothetical protein
VLTETVFARPGLGRLIVDSIRSRDVVVVQSAVMVLSVTFIAVNSSVTINETGLPAGLLATHGWTATLHGLANHTESGSVGFAVPNGTYGLLVTGPSGYASDANGSLTVRGTTHLVVTFTVARTLTLTFSERGLAKGQMWCVAVDGARACATSGPVKYRDLAAGIYSYAVETPTKGQLITARIGTTPVSASGTLSVTHSESVALTFAHPYAVTFTASGLSSGNWSISIKGHTESAPWNRPILFNLTNGTYSYKIGGETGFRSSGTPIRAAVKGGPLSVSVTFRAKPGRSGPIPMLGIERVDGAGLPGRTSVGRSMSGA